MVPRRCREQSELLQAMQFVMGQDSPRGTQPDCGFLAPTLSRLLVSRAASMSVQFLTVRDPFPLEVTRLCRNNEGRSNLLYGCRLHDERNLDE